MQQPNGSFYQPSGYPGYPYPPQAAAPPTPDAKTLEVFKKNWEYYSRNPIEMENLGKSNPAKHANLFRYVWLFSKRRGTHKFHGSPLARYNFEKLPPKVKVRIL